MYLVRSPETQDQPAHAVMEAEKSHSPLSANWKTRNLGGIIESDFKGLRTKEVGGVIPSLRLKV